MGKLEELIQKYLTVTNVMQLATSVDGHPWACTVHFWADDNFSLYWISTEARRHSQEIKQNQKVAAAILAHENTPDEKYMIGLSIEGAAEFLGQDPGGQISEQYAAKLQKPQDLMADIKTGKNPHRFYRLVPSRIVLCDTKEFPENPWQEWKSN
jgi:uncharacterized protein YhbP (UPF0306 family)